MEDLLKQMVAIEHSRVDREDKRVENEAIARKQDNAQMAEQRETDKRMMAEQRETDKRMMAEQHDRFMQLLRCRYLTREIHHPHQHHVCISKKFARKLTTWQLT